MRVLILCILAAASLPALAENQLTDRERSILVQQQQQREVILARAKQRCIEQRGVDCDTEQGLQEWVLLERSRESAVLDRITPLPVPSSGSGATTPAPGR
jgi:type II secretory pathway pseudopilin PulG